MPHPYMEKRLAQHCFFLFLALLALLVVMPSLVGTVPITCIFPDLWNDVKVDSPVAP